MNVPRLAQSLHHYLEAGLATSTLKAYKAAMKWFAAFSELHNIHKPFPLTELLLCYYTSYLANQGLAPQSLAPQTKV